MKTKGINKYEIIREILTDKYMLPETKLALVFAFYTDRKNNLSEKEMKEILNFSDYKIRRVVKQLKELNLLEEL